METPRLPATSRGVTPLASSFLADLILLSVICRLRPPLRPNWRATSRPARVHSMVSSRSISARLAINVEEKTFRRGTCIDGVCEALELYAASLKLANQVHEVFDAATKTVEFPYDQGVALAQGFLRLGQSGPFGPAAAQLVGENLLAADFCERFGL